MVDQAKCKSKMPSPAERPDLYDGYDCRPPRKYSEEERAYWDSVTPEHVKEAIKKRKSTPTSSA
ncbi:hypothetical protein [Solimonas fluminis]|uniref:hypothetical protein n=1 Tax=Solimonas fluminis TaxID=2086571 RepID=UPI001056E4FF|nr:hypothetical protein [Solimonas fluminis]